MEQTSDSVKEKRKYLSGLSLCHRPAKSCFKHLSIEMRHGDRPGVTTSVCIIDIVHRKWWSSCLSKFANQQNQTLRQNKHFSTNVCWQSQVRSSLTEFNVWIIITEWLGILIRLDLLCQTGTNPFHIQLLFSREYCQSKRARYSVLMFSLCSFYFEGHHIIMVIHRSKLCKIKVRNARYLPTPLWPAGHCAGDVCPSPDGGLWTPGAAGVVTTLAPPDLTWTPIIPHPLWHYPGTDL